MIIFETYIAYFITPIKRFAELNVTYSKSIAGIERVFDIFDIKPEIHEKEINQIVEYFNKKQEW